MTTKQAGPTKPKRILRKKTKHTDNPVQQVRLITEMNQADFAASLGITKDGLTKIETGKRGISDELKAKIYDRYGAAVNQHGYPAQAFGKTGMEPYTQTSYRTHKQLFKPLWEPFRINEALRALELMIEAARAKAAESFDNGLVRLLRFEFIAMAERLVVQFGLRDEIRNQLSKLRRSKNGEDIRLCYLLCKITGSSDFMNALNDLPEKEKLIRAGMLEAATKGNIGKWFQDYVYPTE